MSHHDYSLNAIDGLKLAVRVWLVPQGTEPRGKIVFVHGFAEHFKAYDDFFPRVAAQGYEITVFDQRGHGRTARDPGDYGIGNDYYTFKDLDKVLQFALAGYDGPAFLWGHSMGGGITFTYMITGTYRDRFSGYLVSSPYVLGHPNIYKGFQGVKIKLLPILDKVAPTHREIVPLRPEWCTNDPGKYHLYTEDPLRHKTGSVALLYAMMYRGKRLLEPEHINKAIDRPLLVSAGDVDFLCDYRASARAVELAPLTDKKYERYEGKPHELHLLKDEDTDVYLKNILAWLDVRTKPVKFTPVPPAKPAAVDAQW